jgi:riboflavin kinase/FMN adenylyltransferase
MAATDKNAHDLDSLPVSLRGCVLSIGIFDGVHLGHRRILETARALAAPIGAPVVAMTLEPPPETLLEGAGALQRLAPPRQKNLLLLEAGADAVVEARVNEAFLSLAAQAFVERILLGKLAPRHVVEGPDFLFGRGRKGNVDFLRQAGAAGGFEVHVAEPATVELDGRQERVSSTLIRRLVSDGSVAGAARCLGRPFALYGPVVRGAGAGRALGFPTVNVARGEQVLPADGVYAGRATLGEREYPAAISVGTRPTMGGSPRGVEAFLLDARGDFYDQFLRLDFVQRLRGQERYNSVQALKDQIAKDVQRVRELIR